MTLWERLDLSGLPALFVGGLVAFLVAVLVTENLVVMCVSAAVAAVAAGAVVDVLERNNRNEEGSEELS